ncbi:long-chain-fatty-acid--CoA ligase [Brevibacterium album]|uniref:long-chain-fatty-acid--CoA ligase n=1 Tax=Brevibacterium album TaxID=417948 RepID=UPI00041D0348|nr:long-chain-fatty-acid--CoA ligase [Brevibacterium album]
MQPWKTPLTPLSFLERSARVFPDRPALAYGERTWTYAELFAAVEERAHALRAAGIRAGDRVAYMLPNVPEMLISMYAVPLIGAVLVPVNTRLAPEEVRYICDHSAARILVIDTVLWPEVTAVAPEFETVETIVLAEDREHAEQPAPRAHPAGTRVVTLEELLAGASAEASSLRWEVDDEEAVLSINYTSGTTGRPKGVEYTHRGAYLNSFSEIVHSGFGHGTAYLWTLPMFHCNGWCTGWAVAAAGGLQVCLREVRGPVIWELIDRHGITHLNGAPTVVTTIMDAEAAHDLDRQLVITTAAAPPSPAMLKRMSAMGFRIVHVYGLTETYGPYTVGEWQEGWAQLDEDARAARQARQGVGMVTAERARVVRTDDDGEELVDVPADGVTMGEVVMRGNNVMKGYHRDPEATAKAFAGGWFHSGDLAVMHPDGYIELRDRAKDVVVSGGENISTIEVEQAILAHPGVADVAVVGVPDERWGERPKAFVVRVEDAAVTAEELLEFLRERLARYKSPRDVEFVPVLPKTSTGKIQKHDLREREWAGHASRIQG